MPIHVYKAERNNIALNFEIGILLNVKLFIIISTRTRVRREEKTIISYRLQFGNNNKYKIKL